MGVRISHVGINIGRSLESSESVNRSLKDIYHPFMGGLVAEIGHNRLGCTVNSLSSASPSLAQRSMT